MLSLTTGLNRREMLRIGSLALGGLSLPMLLQSKAAAQPGAPNVTTGKSVIFLFLHGGPSQYETFDPKQSAPQEIRGTTGEIPTTVPGLTFGSNFPRIARHAHKMAVVRSFVTERGTHDLKPLVDAVTLNANMGSLYSRIVGPMRSNGMPTNAGIFPNAVDPMGNAPITQFGNFASAGHLGAAYAPFIPGGGGQLQQNMTLNLPQDRLEDRRALLAQIDQLHRQIDANGAIQAVDRFHEQAIDVILGGVADAFDLRQEDPRLVARYDTSHMLAPDRWQRWNNRERYAHNVRNLGKLLLLSRRLCERGCGFVTVGTDFVWDMHADVNNMPCNLGMELIGRPLDHALSAFFDDLEARGLSDRILLVVCGEMGRTPRLNNGGGRDHWGRIAPLVLFGGGVTHGQVIGQSNRDGGEPATEPVRMQNLIATIMHTLLRVSDVRLMPNVPSDVLRIITEHNPIPGI